VAKILLLFLLVFSVDQISKLAVVHFGFPHIINSGAAFGIFPNQVGLLVLISVAILVFLFTKSPKPYNLKTQLPYILILGGGVSNLFDRLRQGYVVDFLDPKIWPSFNLADTAIVVGVFLLIGQFVFPRKVS